MAANKELFSSQGAYSPAEFMPFTALSRIVDFSKENTAAEDVCDFLPLPADFIPLGIYVKELEKCTQGNVTVTCGSGSGAATSGQVAVGGAALAHKYVAQSGKEITSVEGGMSTITTSAAMSKGKLKVTVVGILPDGDSVMNAVHDPWRKPNNKTVSDVVSDLAIGNTSKGDAV